MHLYTPLSESVVLIETQGLMTLRLTKCVLKAKHVPVITNQWGLLGAWLHKNVP